MPRFYVHRYDVVRIKVAVDAVDHKSAMAAADAAIEANSHSLLDVLRREWVGPEFEALIPAPALIHMEGAEETTGYVVDEADDENYRNTRSYGASGDPDDGRPPVTNVDNA